jgi:oligopeptide/dipeptide ABC transporter ATP-binding protein
LLVRADRDERDGGVTEATQSSRPLPILETVGVTKHFGGGRSLLTRSPVIRAVDSISLAIQPGETFAIVGESGCGKSTYARLLTRLLDPSAGTVHYAGNDLAQASGDEMRRIRRELQFVFQDPFASLNPRMNVGAIIGEPLWLEGMPRAERRERVAALLATVGLPASTDRYPHEFSGGQRQRIAIARALAGGPKVVIGDEPVSALDVSVQAQIVNLLEDLKNQFHLTLVIVAQDLAVIRHMSERVAVMYLGEVVELAPTDTLFRTPLHPYTQALLAAIPIPSLAVRPQKTVLGGDVPSPAAPPSGCRFHTRCPHVRPRCRDEHPALESAGDDRTVACHFWRDIGGLATPPPSNTRSTAFERRLEIYRGHQTAKASSPTSLGDS